MNKILTQTLIVLMTSLLAFSAHATCKANSLGAVYCSKYSGGGASVNSLGSVECGKGQCAVNSLGSVKCSKVQGGGAAVNGLGTVKCFGGCEDGSEYMCVQGK